MVPSWLHILSIAVLALGAICAAVIAFDLLRHPQHMAIMNIVWPVNALFGTVLSLWGYFRYGRLATDARAKQAMERGEEMPSRKLTPYPAIVGKGTSHCGSGCTLGDICAETLVFLVPTIAVWLGWHSLFSEKMYATWVLDFLFAYAFGIAFQYFTIKPMRDVGPGQALIAAFKADTLSLIAWQVGMYGFMAFAVFQIFRAGYGVELQPNMPEFWFMMQIAMLCGFVTAYPVNWWLISRGIKEKM